MTLPQSEASVVEKVVDYSGRTTTLCPRFQGALNEIRQWDASRTENDVELFRQAEVCVVSDLFVADDLSVAFQAAITWDSLGPARDEFERYRHVREAGLRVGAPCTTS